MSGFLHHSLSVVTPVYGTGSGVKELVGMEGMQRMRGEKYVKGVMIACVMVVFVGLFFPCSFIVVLGFWCVTGD